MRLVIGIDDVFKCFAFVKVVKGQIIDLDESIDLADSDLRTEFIGLSCFTSDDAPDMRLIQIDDSVIVLVRLRLPHPMLLIMYRFAYFECLCIGFIKRINTFLRSRFNRF